MTPRDRIHDCAWLTGDTVSHAQSCILDQGGGGVYLTIMLGGDDGLYVGNYLCVLKLFVKIETEQRELY